jgi:hypothetical protein
LASTVRTFRDASGRTHGSATQSGSRTILRDSSGRTIGSANTTGNRTTVRDASGRTIESANTNRDRITFRSSGRSNLGSASQSRNQITFRDASGRSIGTANNNGSRTTFRDSSGRSTVDFLPSRVRARGAMFFPPLFQPSVPQRPPSSGSYNLFVAIPFPSPQHNPFSPATKMVHPVLPWVEV